MYRTHQRRVRKAEEDYAVRAVNSEFDDAPTTLLDEDEQALAYTDD
jgi:hypothetical protein